MNILIATDIEDERWTKAIDDIESTIQNVKNATFAYMAQNEHLEFLSAQNDININLCLSNDENIRQLNRDFRHIDKPTNVLSFANLDFAGFTAENELFGCIELGDIIIAFETTNAQAIEQQISLFEHFCHLLVHGLLHLLGYDHQEPHEQAQMESLEAAILARLNIKNPYTDEQ